jgi:quercetin dioxygenase-like cupin family protein
MQPEIIFLKETYKKENGLWVLDFDDIKVPFKIVKRSLVYFPPFAVGGNHSHPRKEAFLGIGEGLELIYMDKGINKKEKMYEKGVLKLFVIPPHLPHAVVNNSKNFAFLIEFADGEQRKVKMEEVV